MENKKTRSYRLVRNNDVGEFLLLSSPLSPIFFCFAFHIQYIVAIL